MTENTTSITKGTLKNPEAIYSSSHNEVNLIIYSNFLDNFQ